MSNKHKSPVIGSIDLPGSTAAASGHGANQLDLADEKATVEGEAADVYEHKDETEIDNTPKTDVDGNAQPNDSQILVCAQVAIKKIDQIDADAKKKIAKLKAEAKKAKSKIKAEAKKAKSQTVQEYSVDLVGKIPNDEICSEITRRLDGRVSPRLIRDCLDEKFKKKHRVENARKQKRKEKDLAALNKTVPLKLGVVVGNSGKQTVEPVTETRQSDHSAKTGINAEANQSGFDDNNTEGTTNSESKEESTITHSFNDEIASPIKQNEASHISMSLEALRRDMYTVLQRAKGTGNACWKLSVDLATRMVETEFCGIQQQKDGTMTSTGKGILRETN
jgi:hypothetical protein